jgi:MscS family membrane protein
MTQMVIDAPDFLRNCRVCLLGTLFCAPLWAQMHVLPLVHARPPAAHPEVNQDPLGRTSPRGTVLGFVTTARTGNTQVASLYLNTPLRGAAAQLLAQQLFTVLDRRLPPRLLELSDSPDGSLSKLTPGQDLVGTLSSVEGPVDILVERVNLDKAGSVWLFSRETLARIPDLFAELDAIHVETVMPGFLARTRIGGVALFNWVGCFVVLPLFYLLLSLLSGLLGLWVVSLRRRSQTKDNTKDVTGNPRILSHPIRLLLLALFIYGILSKVALPLLARQIWGTLAVLLVITACVWLSVGLNGSIENYLCRRLARSGNVGARSVVHLGRRLLELLVICAAVLIGLYLCGFNPTTALAGLGIGGIAVALAAQKTLENVIGGVSIISDGVVRVGDTLKVGGTVGTIEEVGLRSTRIRTPDRTVVSVPNGHLANLSLECISSRDKFWFHPSLRLRYDTTAAQMQSILDGLRNILTRHPLVDPDSVRVRLLQFGTYALELDVFAYIKARDWNHFMEIQEELLLRYMETVQAAGAQIAVESVAVPVSPNEQLAFVKSNAR